MKKLILTGKAKKVFRTIEAIARKYPDMPLALYNEEDLKEFQFSIDVAENVNEFSKKDIEQFIQIVSHKNIENWRK